MTLTRMISLDAEIDDRLLVLAICAAGKTTQDSTLQTPYLSSLTRMDHPGSCLSTNCFPFCAKPGKALYTIQLTVRQGLVFAQAVRSPQGGPGAYQWSTESSRNAECRRPCGMPRVSLCVALRRQIRRGRRSRSRGRRRKRRRRGRRRRGGSRGRRSRRGGGGGGGGGM